MGQEAAADWDVRTFLRWIRAHGLVACPKTSDEIRDRDRAVLGVRRTTYDDDEGIGPARSAMGECSVFSRATADARWSAVSSHRPNGP